MASDVSICNMALISLGADTIASLTEDSENARKLNAVYDYLRDEELRSFPWNFAIRWATLAQLDETPTNDFSYTYQLPRDPLCLKVIRLKGDDQIDYDYRIENGKLYTDLDGVTIEYIAQITDATTFDSNFVVSFSARLAAELAYAITGSAEVAKAKWEEYSFKMKRARSIDSQEGKPDKIDDSGWIDERDGRTV